jgi:PIN domain nuclease of toxin-antitoxin system
MATTRWDALPIWPSHAIAAGALPRHHADPFDRMLIAQARLEQMVLVAANADFTRYDVAILGRDGL